MSRVILAFLIVTVTSARADGLSPPPGLTPPTQTQPAAVAKKSPTVAVLLSAGISLAGMGAMASHEETPWKLGVAAAFVGPATGQWYARRTGWPGLVTRLVAAGLIKHGLELQDGYEGADCLGIDDQRECNAILDAADRSYKRGDRYIYAGTAIWLTSTLFDVALAHYFTTTWNERSSVVAAPTLVGGTPGLAIAGSF